MFLCKLSPSAALALLNPFLVFVVVNTAPNFWSNNAISSNDFDIACMSVDKSPICWASRFWLFSKSESLITAFPLMWSLSFLTLSKYTLAEQEVDIQKVNRSNCIDFFMVFRCRVELLEAVPCLRQKSMSIPLFEGCFFYNKKGVSTLALTPYP